MNKNEFMYAIKKMQIETDEKNMVDLYDRFEIYRKELIEWNKSLNLTRIVDKDEIYIKHFLDCLSVFQFNYFNDKSISLSVLDIGTGAGFPGIPMKIFMPNLKITLMDSLKKRVVFLEHISDILNLDINCVHGRAEDFGHNVAYREKFDIVVSRAVANFSTLLEYSLPFVKRNGYFIALKGKSYQEEINFAAVALEKLGGQIEGIFDANIINSDFEHKLIIISKKKPIKEIYPRRSGVPSKNPL